MLRFIRAMALSLGTNVLYQLLILQVELILAHSSRVQLDTEGHILWQELDTGSHTTHLGSRGMNILAYSCSPFHLVRDFRMETHPLRLDLSTMLNLIQTHPECLIKLTVMGNHQFITTIKIKPYYPYVSVVENIQLENMNGYCIEYSKLVLIHASIHPLLSKVILESHSFVFPKRKLE